MNELSKKLMCVQMRSGVEIWVEDQKAERLQDILETINQSKFIRFEGQTFNTADIVGVFLAGTMADLTRRKNGQTQCAQGTWHDKGDKCACIARADKELIAKREMAIAACGKCMSGYIQAIGGSMCLCECQKSL